MAILLQVSALMDFFACKYHTVSYNNEYLHENVANYVAYGLDTCRLSP